MFSWLAKGILTRNMARLREGDYRPLLRLDAKDIRFRFPGDSSWATEIDRPRRPRAVAPALRRHRPEDLPGRGDRPGPAVEHDAVRARHRPSRRAGGPRLREPLRHLGPHVVGTAARVRGLRGHAGEQGSSMRTCERSEGAEPCATCCTPPPTTPPTTWRAWTSGRCTRPRTTPTCLEALGGPLPEDADEPAPGARRSRRATATPDSPA